MNTYGPTVQGCKFTNVTLEGDQRAFVPGCSFMENSVIAAASRSTFQYIALLSGPSYGARPVPVSWSSFGVAAASVTDVSGKPSLVPSRLSSTWRLGGPQPPC